MQRIRRHNDFAELVGASIQAEPFRLVVVGTLGDGLEPGWKSFGPSLSALAVVQPPAAPGVGQDDPAVSVVAADLSAPGPFWAAAPFGRFSDARARTLQTAESETAESLEEWLRRGILRATPGAAPNLDYHAAFNKGPNALSEAIDAAGFGEADFIRLNAGWSDFDLLTRLGPILERPSLQGVALKAHLHGSHDATENTFHNMDRLMRQKGFELFYLEPQYYASAALPWPFMDGHPAQTEGGRATFASALYLRDLSAAGEGLKPATIAKAAALRAVHGLPDQAAELLVLFRDPLTGVVDVDAALDLLALQVQADGGEKTKYKDYIAAFEAGEARFYNLYEQRDRWLKRLLKTSQEAPVKIADLEEKIRQLAAKLRDGGGDGRPRSEKPKAWFGKGATREAFDEAAVRQRLTERSEAHPGHHWIFDHYGPWRGPLEKGVGLVDYIGSVTGAEVGFAPSPPSPRFIAAMPQFDEEYFEWTDLLEAVRDAGDTFTMLELGAGYGRWSARGALAARRLGKSVRLGVAEAEPKHALWLQNHFARNGIEDSSYQIFPTAVGGQVGSVVFAIEAPADLTEDNWFGQAILPLDVVGREPTGEYFGLPTYEVEGWKLIVVPQVPLSHVLKAYRFVDIADFDLQGAEADAIEEAIKPLTEKVRRLHIGTHGQEIEVRLRKTLGGAGWVCLQDYGFHQRHDTPYGNVTFVDGVQSWVNPALW